MPTISFNRFDGGIDLRKGRAESDANRMRMLKNCYVTTGWQIRKRPGVTKVATLETGTTGLFAHKGQLHTFYCAATAITHANTLFNANQLKLDTGYTAITSLRGVVSFNNNLYVSARHTGPIYRHHYLDGAAVTMVVDANCPNGSSIAKGAEKIFCAQLENVHFCATNAPRDWTTANDAGFLPTGRQTSGASTTASALGIHRNKLAVFAEDSIQTWNIDPDPTRMSFDQAIKGIGIRGFRHVEEVGGELFFLSNFGIRAVRTQMYQELIEDTDVGSPIDELVDEQADLTSHRITVHYERGGQFWSIMGDTAFVFSYSKTSKLSAWSIYEFAFSIDWAAVLNGELYLRSGDDVYKVQEDTFTDDGSIYPVSGMTPYLSFKRPGILKSITGLDVVSDGTADYKVYFDSRDDTALMAISSVANDTRPGGLIPVGASGTEIAVGFTNEDDQDFRLDAINLHYELMGLM